MFRKDQGFTLIELMIVVAIIAIIAAIAVPNLLSSRLAANESNAISTLRNLVSAQAQFQSTAAVDDDRDGTGEYGSFAEMSGAINLNTRPGGFGPATPLNPPILASTFATINANGEVSKSGYFFQIYLPDVGATPQPEIAGPGGPPAAVDADMCEVLWACYAWPADAGTTGNRSFFVNQRGEILQTKMDVLTYELTGGGPAGDAVFTVAADMSAPVSINGLPAVAQDGNTWNPVQ